MKLMTLLGLGAVGGFMYMHRKRGGEMSRESLLETGRDLFDRAKGLASRAREDGLASASLDGSGSNGMNAATTRH